MKTELVITSDDLGMTLSVNRGIDRARALGALTSTNFMVPCPWFEHSARLFRDAEIDLGVHLTLTCEWSSYKWRPLTRAPSLLAADGCMYRTVRELMHGARAEDIRAECREQIAMALRRNLRISYVDVHMCIPTIREQGSGGALLANADFELALMNIVNGIAREFGLAYPYALQGDRLEHFRSALSISGKSRDHVEQYLRALEPGVHHLSCHCAVESDEQDHLSEPEAAEYPWSLPYRSEDLRTITSSWFRDLLAAQGVSLVRMPFTAPGAAATSPGRAR